MNPSNRPAIAPLICAATPILGSELFLVKKWWKQYKASLPQSTKTASILK